MRIAKMLNAGNARSTLFHLLCFLYLGCFAWSSSRATPPDASSVILIQNATVMTVSHGTIEHGSVLIEDGKIVEVGQFIKAPAGDELSDAWGQFVIPGIIDCHSDLRAESINDGGRS